MIRYEICFEKHTIYVKARYDTEEEKEKALERLTGGMLYEEDSWTEKKEEKKDGCPGTEELLEAMTKLSQSIEEIRRKLPDIDSNREADKTDSEETGAIETAEEAGEKAMAGDKTHEEAVIPQPEELEGIMETTDAPASMPEEAAAYTHRNFYQDLIEMYDAWINEEDERLSALKFWKVYDSSSILSNISAPEDFVDGFNQFFNIRFNEDDTMEKKVLMLKKKIKDALMTERNRIRNNKKPMP